MSLDCAEGSLADQAALTAADLLLRDGLLQRAQMLAARLPALGIGPDLAALSLVDLWGVYRFLVRVGGHGQ